MMHPGNNRFIVTIAALIWEIIRIGLLWRVNSTLVSTFSESVHPFYLIWLLAPAAVVVAGYLLFLFDQHAGQLGIMLCMSRGFYVILGLIGIMTLLYARYQVPFGFIGFCVILGVILLDLVFGTLQFLSLKSHPTVRRTM